MSVFAQLAVIVLVVLLALAVVLLIPSATRDRPYETDERLDDEHDQHEE